MFPSARWTSCGDYLLLIEVIDTPNLPPHRVTV